MYKGEGGLRVVIFHTQVYFERELEYLEWRAEHVSYLKRWLSSEVYKDTDMELVSTTIILTDMCL